MIGAWHIVHAENMKSVPRIILVVIARVGTAWIVTVEVSSVSRADRAV